MSSSSTSQGEVQATVGALQARMIFALRAMHGSTSIPVELQATVLRMNGCDLTRSGML